MKFLFSEIPDIRGSAASVRRALLEQVFSRVREAPSDEGGELSFLRSCAGVLPTDKWAPFLCAWARALSAYGTSLSFMRTLRRNSGCFEVDGARYRFHAATSDSYAARHELMAKQARYVPMARGDTYRFHHDTDCLLCQNVLQGTDAGFLPELVRNNLLLELGNLVLLPNRYPAQPGASLLVTRDHRAPIGAWDRGQLEAALWFCDSMQFVMLRNHPRDGMSIPSHEHFHVLPADLVGIDLVGAIQPKELQKIGIGSGGTPFATAFIRGNSSEETAALARPILMRLEEDGVIFSLAYAQKTLAITPRRLDLAISAVGAGVGLHLFDGSNPAATAAAFDAVPLRGEFDWSKYLH
jgi:hypothetical protein